MDWGGIILYRKKGYFEKHSKNPYTQFLLFLHLSKQKQENPQESYWLADVDWAGQWKNELCSYIIEIMGISKWKRSITWANQSLFLFFSGFK